MSPQLLWTIAGLVLTVLTLGGVTISSYQSMDSSTGKLLASEAGNIAITTKLWVANKSTDGTFSGITAESVGAYIPDLTVTGSGATSKFTSKANPAVTYSVTSTMPFATTVISVAGLTATQGDAMHAALTGKACTSAHTTAASTLTYTCNG